MIESSRRHGYLDPRWNMTKTRARHPLRAAEDGDHPSIQNWENEGGRYSSAGQKDAPGGLDWNAFSSRYFPDRRRHDLDVIKAYEAYRWSASTCAPRPTARLSR